MPEKKADKEKTEEKTKGLHLAERESRLEKMIVEAKPAGIEPPTPRPKKDRSDQQEKDEK